MSEQTWMSRQSTDNAPKISVVSTVYNGISHLDKAIPSIRGQSFSQYEYVIVDDGSTDGTKEALIELAAQDTRIRVLSPGRLGRARALNYAIEHARGEYIAQQDFDDISHPKRLESQLRFLESRPDVGLVGGYYVVEDFNRGEKYVRMPPNTDAGLRAAMARYIPFAHTLVMFRRAAWQQADGYPVVDDIEDLRLWIRFAENGWKLASLSEVLGVHYVYEASYWHKTFTYRSRQRTLARVQASAIWKLRLPLWYLGFPLGRLFYGSLPNELKRWARKRVGRYNESRL